MLKFETSDRKSLKVKPLKPTAKVVATSASSQQKENEFITSITFVSRGEEFFRENKIYSDVIFGCGEDTECTYKVKDIYYEISFADGFRFFCRNAEGMLKFYVVEGTPNASLNGTDKCVCIGGSSSLVELRKRLRNKVPVIGTFATGFGEMGVRCVFNNTYVALRFSDGDATGFSLNEELRATITR